MAGSKTPTEFDYILRKLFQNMANSHPNLISHIHPGRAAKYSIAAQQER